jgi:septum formation protein
MQHKKRLVLASTSPRRVQLLKQIGINVDVLPSSVDEIIDPAVSPDRNAMNLAMMKAKDVGVSVGDAIVIGADTIVAVGETLLGKPRNVPDAIRMLETLSGRVHTVYTGIALLDMPSGRSVTDVEVTRVTFRTLPRREIEEYVASGSPMDKAGAYGIQDDYGAVFVSRIEGCYHNVVGLPLSKLYLTLQNFQSELRA